MKKKTSNNAFNLTYLSVTDLAKASSAPLKTQVKAAFYRLASLARHACNTRAPSMARNQHFNYSITNCNTFSMVCHFENFLEKPLTEVLIKPEDISFPMSIRPFLDGASVYDCSSSASSKTYKFKKQAETYFCKVGPSELLAREVRMNRFFSSHGIGPRVLHYLESAEQGYLVTDALSGMDGISPENLQNPEKLASTFGRSLARVHSLPTQDCPFPKRNEEMHDLAMRNIENGIFAEYLIPEGLQLGKEKYFQLRNLAKADAVIHGDYCLPNIILRDFELVGFLDLGNGGFGDSHHDLFWGLWTLEYNLKTNRFNEVFLNAYGHDRVDFDRIEFNRLLSGFMD